MKTTKEKIEVMQAFDDGKQIQFQSGDGDWDDCTPIWDWDCFDYRIKPEPKEPTYRPYKSVAELVEDFDKRFPHQNKRPHHTMPFIWVRRKYDRTILLYCFFYSEPQILRKDFDNFTYLDGTPFGKLVEE